MKLYFSPFSPYVRKCLVTAHELGLDQRIELLPCAAHPVQRDAKLVADNPLGKIPTFFSDDGLVLFDSRVICEYLNDLGQGSIFPPAGRARWEALTLHSLADGMLDAALLIRYEMTARPEALRWADWQAGQMAKIEAAMGALDGQVAALKGRVDIGTLALACALGYLDLRYDAWGWRGRFPGVAEWAEGFMQRPSMLAVWAA